MICLISLSSILLVFDNGAIRFHKNIVNNISSTEIIVFKSIDGQGNVDYSQEGEEYPLSKEEVDALRSIEHVSYCQYRFDCTVDNSIDEKAAMIRGDLIEVLNKLEAKQEGKKLKITYPDYIFQGQIYMQSYDPNYDFNEKIKIIKELFISSKLNKNEIYELNASLDFFQKEFFNLDSRTKGILISEITRITNTFISDYDVLNTFCSPKEKLSFDGFSSVINEGKIVVLNMNIAEYSLLSKIIAAYLKLDFQTEVLQNLSNNKSKISVFICDEYDKYCTKTDGDFFSVSREAKCINIVSTQSYSSLKNALKDDASVKVIIQNLINKIWFRTDDLFTIEEAQKQLGKEEKVKISRSISESAKETKFSYITNTLNSQGSNISESYNSYKQNDFIFETNFFTQNLETFTALTFLSDGNKIYKPSKIKLYPYFKERD